jgi:hypothetical protein
MPFSLAALSDEILALFWLPQEPDYTRSSSTNRYRTADLTTRRFVQSVLSPLPSVPSKSAFFSLSSYDVENLACFSRYSRAACEG